MKEAIEDLFIPLCIYNNTKDDADDRTRRAFKEPAWNNPVVRILNQEKQDLVDRVTDDWTVAALARAMGTALKKNQQAVPPYLALLLEEAEAATRPLETAVYGMD